MSVLISDNCSPDISKPYLSLDDESERINSIADQIHLHPDTGSSLIVSKKIAADAFQYFKSQNEVEDLQPIRCKHKGDNSALPRTVIRTANYCVYMLQTKDGTTLLGRGEYSKVGRVIIVHQNGNVEVQKGKVLVNEIEKQKAAIQSLKKYSSLYIEPAPFLEFDYISEKHQEARRLLVSEMLAFDGLSEEMKALPLLQKLSILADLAEGLSDIHVKDDVHNDQKPENFLVRKIGLGKYQGVNADLGLSTQKGVKGRLKGTSYWYPPEIILTRGSCTVAKDIWAFGISMYQILRGRDPPFLMKLFNKCLDLGLEGKMALKKFLDDLESITTEQIEKNLFPAGWIDSLHTKEIEDLIRKCLSKCPINRPSAKCISNKLREIINLE